MKATINKKPTISDLMESYEATILQTILATFGLDFLTTYQHGGDVDTVHNVDQIGKDPLMTYKNKKNEADYNNRGEYNSKDYHAHPAYKESNKAYSDQKKQGTLKDGYTGKKIDKNKSYDQDHVVAANKIHNNRARVLADLNGPDLANKKENLVATDPSINRSKKADSVDEHLKKKGDRYDDTTKQNMQDKEKKARKAIYDDINKAYYTSQKFWKDTGKAALKAGGTMALRQGIGFFLVEIWFGIKEKCISCWDKINSFKDFKQRLIEGFKSGISSAMAKFSDLWEHVKNGAIGGFIASLTTTFTNIFKTTFKSVNKVIMHLGKPVVEAFRVALFNPDKLPTDERIDAIIKCFVTGGSLFLGDVIKQYLDMQLVGIPHSDLITAFFSALLSGITMATGFYLVDRYEVGAKLMSLFSNPEYEYLKTVGENAKKRLELINSMVDRIVHYDWEACERALQNYHSSAGMSKALVSVDIARICGVNEDEIIKDIIDLDKTFG